MSHCFFFNEVFVLKWRAFYCLFKQKYRSINDTEHILETIHEVLLYCNSMQPKHFWRFYTLLPSLERRRTFPQQELCYIKTQWL